MKYKRLFITLIITISSHLFGSETTKYVRYTHEGQESYGILEGDTVRELVGDIFSAPTPSGKTLKLSEVHLLAPCKPTKVIAVGLNYRSHIGNRPVPKYPGLFAKYPTSIIGQEKNIVMPSDATDLHYEGELVIVIGKTAKNISVSKAPNYIFGVTAGNDVSERNWQQADLQWLRAKASDTFGPVGPAIVTGLNYNDLLLQTRLNGELRQSGRTKDLVYNVEEIVSFISHYVTLFPGDLVFTGTPGTTKAMKPNDIVEIELEGVGILRNKVVSSQQ